MDIETTRDTMEVAGPARFAMLAVRVAEARDQAAFAELFDHFAPRLVAYLMRNGSDRQMAEEISQDAMIVLWHKAHLFDPAKSSVGTWLYRVARNRRIDLLRRDKSDRIDPNDPVFHPSPPTAADEEMDAVQRDDRVRRALAKLQDEQRELVRLAFFEGLSHSQIAERHGLPLGTVKSRIRLAFKKLRDALEADPLVDTDL